MSSRTFYPCLGVPLSGSLGGPAVPLCRSPLVLEGLCLSVLICLLSPECLSVTATVNLCLCMCLYAPEGCVCVRVRVHGSGFSLGGKPWVCLRLWMSVCV